MANLNDLYSFKTTSSGSSVVRGNNANNNGGGGMRCNIAFVSLMIIVFELLVIRKFFG